MLEEPASATGLRHNMIEIERIIGKWGRLTNKPFDEETSVGKLREFSPMNVWNYIARSLRNTVIYREWVDMPMNQLTNPKTGMLQGEKAPTLNEMADGDVDDDAEWEKGGTVRSERQSRGLTAEIHRDGGKGPERAALHKGKCERRRQRRRRLHEVYKGGGGGQGGGGGGM